MKLRALLASYKESRISNGIQVWDVSNAQISEEHLDREVTTCIIDNLDTTVIWHFDAPRILAIWFADGDKGNGEPCYVIPLGSRRGRPSQDKVNQAFTVDREVSEAIAQVPEGQRSIAVNKALRQAFIIEEK